MAIPAADRIAVISSVGELFLKCPTKGLHWSTLSNIVKWPELPPRSREHFSDLLSAGERRDSPQIYRSTAVTLRKHVCIAHS